MCRSAKLLERISKRIARAEARAKTTQARRAKQAYQREIRRWSATKLAAFAAGLFEMRSTHIVELSAPRRKGNAFSPGRGDEFWVLSKQDQADLIWKTLFIENSPISEACLGVLTALERFGLDVGSRDLVSFRRYFQSRSVEQQIDDVFRLAGVKDVVMTNDPFDADELPAWNGSGNTDGQFHAALRFDGLLNNWDKAYACLCKSGFKVSRRLDGRSLDEVRRFLSEWIERMKAVYMAVSLPPDFDFPDRSVRTRLIRDAVLPIAEECGIPFAMMIGVKKLTNPKLRVADDSVGRASIDVVEHLCREYPQVKFLVTMLSRENQHELCLAARKFSNLMIFGCWWYLNNPSIIDMMTRQRMELLGTSFIPQYSDARVLDQLVYKWSHSRRILGDVLFDKYKVIAATGWTVSEPEIRRDVEGLLGGNFWTFLGKSM